MVYEKQQWENLPSQATPLSATRLLHMETQYDEAVGEMSEMLALKANLVNGKVPVSELPTSTAATANTVPVRGTGGIVQGVGTPVSASDAATKAYVDSRLFATSTSPTADTVPLRGSGGRLLGIGTPTAASDAATKAYVDTLGTDMATFETQVALQQDMFTSSRISTSLDGTMTQSSPIEFHLFYAPFRMQVTGITLVFDNPLSISGSTNSTNVRIVHRQNSGATAIEIVTKNTSVQGIGGNAATDRRKPWSMTNGTWGPIANRQVPMGNSVSLVFGTFTGNATVEFPLTATVEWRPVR